MAEAERTDQAEDDLFGERSNPSRVVPEWADPTTRPARVKAALARAQQAAEKAAAPDRARAAAAQDGVQQAEQQVAEAWAAAEQRYQTHQQQRADADAGLGPRPSGRRTPGGVRSSV